MGKHEHVRSVNDMMETAMQSTAALSAARVRPVLTWPQAASIWSKCEAVHSFSQVETTAHLAGHGHDAAVVPLLQHDRRLQQLGADAEGGGLEHGGQVRPRGLYVTGLPAMKHAGSCASAAG